MTSAVSKKNFVMARGIVQGLQAYQKPEAFDHGSHWSANTRAKRAKNKDWSKIPGLCAYLPHDKS